MKNKHNYWIWIVITIPIILLITLITGICIVNYDNSKIKIDRINYYLKDKYNEKFTIKFIKKYKIMKSKITGIVYNGYGAYDTKKYQYIYSITPKSDPSISFYIMYHTDNSYSNKLENESEYGIIEVSKIKREDTLCDVSKFYGDYKKNVELINYLKDYINNNYPKGEVQVLPNSKNFWLTINVYTNEQPRIEYEEMKKLYKKLKEYISDRDISVSITFSKNSYSLIEDTLTIEKNTPNELSKEKYQKIIEEGSK